MIRPYQLINVGLDVTREGVSMNPQTESSEDIDKPWKLMELLVDPVRAKIYFEVLVKGELKAQDLMSRLTIARSTLTHHLTKFVEAGVFEVRVDSVGRPIKHYSLSVDFEETVVVKGRDSSVKALERKIAFMESTAAHMQMIANLARMTARQLSEKTVSETSDKVPTAFAFHLVSNNDAKVWTKHHSTFLANVQSELVALNGSKKQKTHVAFSGLVHIPEDSSTSSDES
jgi:DNA-binding transcriptional ArsR family regulator